MPGIHGCRRKYPWPLQARGENSLRKLCSGLGSPFKAFHGRRSMDEHSLQFWSQKISKAHMEQCKPIACGLTQNKTRCVWSLHFSDLEAKKHFCQTQNSSRQRRSFRKQEGLRRYQNWTGLISPPKHCASTIWKLVLDKKRLFQGKTKRLDGSYGPLWVLKRITASRGLLARGLGWNL